MNKKILISLIIIVALLSLALFFKKSSWLQKNEKTTSGTVFPEFIDESNLNAEVISQQNLVVAYLEDNISQLSPEKEVLGGKFYLTSLDFINDNEVIITYEDGHIALSAQVIFSLKQNNSQEMEVIIEKFEITKN